MRGKQKLNYLKAFCDTRLGWEGPNYPSQFLESKVLKEAGHKYKPRSPTA
jgi:hypothetical protein